MPRIKIAAREDRAAAVRADTIEECAKLVEPKGPRPCDCEPFGCYCHNNGDAAAVAAWDADMATAAMIRGLSTSEPDKGATIWIGDGDPPSGHNAPTGHDASTGQRIFVGSGDPPND
ncbi:hypothetical protein CQ12_21455 [Bradyrhizobium jicamae]|uniref:Uncharacterized protein n=1 Tax=Bradyrhizobium jicamae TaxID=280332 RepID=A0A0R3LYY1_9BRAD|nr:hypothetical protein [Bradyrhizobium jicamae]KRR10837.1 hypothetical protein CQ12_21455 [Bradyrhizobium jicamae]